MDPHDLHITSLLRRQQAPPSPPAGGSNSLDEFLKLVQDPFSSALVTRAFWTSLGTSVAVTLVLALLFSLLRPHHAVVYAPRLKRGDKAHAPPPVGRGLLSWLAPVLKTNESQTVDWVGVDAAVFLRYTRMCRNMFLLMSIAGCGILIPANLTGADKNIMRDQTTFTLMTPLLVFGKPLWAQVVCAWLFDVVVAYFLWANYRAVTRLRRAYFDSAEYRARLHSRTLLMTDIPNSLRSDEGVLKLSTEIKSTAGEPRSVIGREVKGLSELHREHEQTVRRLESILAKYLKKPQRLPSTRPTCKTAKGDDRYESRQTVDAIDYLTDRMQRLEAKVRVARENIDIRRPMPYGFSSYDTAHEAHAVAYKARKQGRRGIGYRLAPAPEDIIWDNLPLTRGSRRWKKLGNTAWVALLTVLWIVPNAMIAIFLANLSNLARVWPAFRTSLYGNPKVWAAVQGIASPAILSLFYLILPIIFRRLSIRAGDVTKTSRERHVVHQLYAFFVFNNLIVFTTFSAIWQFVTAVVKTSEVNQDILAAIRQGKLGSKLLSALCTVSPFWVTWLLQRNLGAAVDLSQVWNLFVIWFAKTFMNPTPRQREEWMRPPPFDYASYYNYFLFYATVALCFATLQPIVLPVGALYFIIDYWLKKYLLMYVFHTKTESGGQFWRIIFNRMVFAAILANVVVVLVVLSRDERTMAMAMIPPPILMICFKIYCKRAFDDDMHFYRRTLDDSESLPLPSKKAIHNENLAARYENPAFYKPLMAPMVKEDAKAALAQIYRGRVHSDSAEPPPSHDGIRLDPMSERQPGKRSGSSSGSGSGSSMMPFRFVPESLLTGNDDPPGYERTATFRREYGIDDMEGRPVDLISERPDTPASLSSAASTYRGAHGTYAAVPPYSRTASPAGRSMRYDVTRPGSAGTGASSTYAAPPLPSHHHLHQHQYQQQQQQQYSHVPPRPYRADSATSISTANDMTPYGDAGDIGASGYMGAGGIYSYAQGNDSEAGLLRGAAAMPSSSSGGVVGGGGRYAGDHAGDHAVAGSGQGYQAAYQYDQHTYDQHQQQPPSNQQGGGVRDPREGHWR